MKFKAGDKVKVRKDLKNGYYGIDDLKDYQNDKVFTIETISSIGGESKYCYTLLEDEEGYFFREEMLIPANEEIILKAIKNEQGFYEIRIPKEIRIYSYGGNGEYDYIKCIKKEEILDEKEKEYLRAVIRPFRDRVKYIKKNTYYEKEFIDIGVNKERIGLPCFKKGKMYKNMKIDKKYSLKELGL